MTPVPELNDLVETVGDRCPSGTELDRLRAASEVAREVGRVGEDLVTHYVDEARAAGASWSDIGDVLGVTRQGAHQRHHDRRRPDRWARPNLGRLTPRARAAVKSAIEEARTADGTFVGTEHVLLGILDTPGNVGSLAIERCGVPLGRLRDEVTGRLLAPESVPRGRRRRSYVPFTPHARRVLDLAVGEALGLGHNYIGCEHLLLAVALSEGIGSEALKATGLEVPALRAAIIELLVGLSTSARVPTDADDEPETEIAFDDDHRGDDGG